MSQNAAIAKLFKSLLINIFVSPEMAVGNAIREAEGVINADPAAFGIEGAEDVDFDPLVEIAVSKWTEINFPNHADEAEWEYASRPEEAYFRLNYKSLAEKLLDEEDDLEDSALRNAKAVIHVEAEKVFGEYSKFDAPAAVTRRSLEQLHSCITSAHARRSANEFRAAVVMHKVVATKVEVASAQAVILEHARKLAQEIERKTNVPLTVRTEVVVGDPNDDGKSSAWTEVQDLLETEAIVIADSYGIKHGEIEGGLLGIGLMVTPTDAATEHLMQQFARCL